MAIYVELSDIKDRTRSKQANMMCLPIEVKRKIDKKCLVIVLEDMYGHGAPTNPSVCVCVCPNICFWVTLFGVATQDPQLLHGLPIQHKFILDSLHNLFWNHIPSVAGDEWALMYEREI